MTTVIHKCVLKILGYRNTTQKQFFFLHIDHFSPVSIFKSTLNIKIKLYYHRQNCKEAILARIFGISIIYMKKRNYPLKNFTLYFVAELGCTHGTWKFPGQGLNPAAAATALSGNCGQPLIL